LKLLFYFIFKLECDSFILEKVSSERVIVELRESITTLSAKETSLTTILLLIIKHASLKDTFLVDMISFMCICRYHSGHERSVAT